MIQKSTPLSVQQITIKKARQSSATSQAEPSLLGSNYDIYVQRVNLLGTPQWTDDGLSICVAGLNQLNPTIISDGAGGAIITWQDYQGGSSSSWDIYAQRINASGSVRWTPNGEAITFFIDDQQNPQITADGSGRAIITWQDNRRGISNPEIYAHQVNASGNA
jgi:hypothetical protein